MKHKRVASPSSHQKNLATKLTARRDSSLSREALFEQVKESTERNRNFFFIWIGFALYVILTTSAITDLQLLLPNSIVTLPTIGVQLPLFGYFLVTPWLVLILHFNLLQNLDTHAHKLHSWARCYPNEQPPRVLLQAFLFDFAMLEYGATFHRLTRWAARLLCYTLGPITIGILLLRFLPYQAPGITDLHMIAFVASTMLVIRSHHKLPQFQPIAIPKGIPYWPGRRFVLPRFLFAPQRALGIIGLLVTIAVWNTFIEIVELPRKTNAKWTDEQLDKVSTSSRFLNIPSKTSLVNFDSDQKLRAELAGEPDFRVWWEEHGLGIDLRGRSLQGAVLHGVDMRHAQLKGAQLQAAILSDAQLQGADLSGAQLQRANLKRAQLEGADLKNANLQGVNLSSANLIGANLFGADLQGANLSSVVLRGANLSYADLRGVDLSHAHLQGADLSSAKLIGANLSGAKMQGATFDELFLPNSIAELDGAIVHGSTVNAMPRYSGVPLVLDWKAASASNIKWSQWLDERPAKSKVKSQKLLDEIKKPPSSSLQKKLDVTRTSEDDYPQIAAKMAPKLCQDSIAKAAQGSLEAWTGEIWRDSAVPQRGAILADALLQENECLSYRETVCRFVKEKGLPIKNTQLCSEN